MAEEKLQAYFKFDEADLEANRSGKFSEKQKARLAALNTRERNAGKILGILLIGVAVFVLIAAPFFYSNPAFLSTALPLGLIGGIIGFIVLRTKSDKNKNYRLHKMQGEVKYSRHVPGHIQGPQFRNRIIHIGKSWFNVVEDMPTILKEGAEYSVYTYAFQGSTYILSAELMAEQTSGISVGA